MPIFLLGAELVILCFRTDSSPLAPICCTLTSHLSPLTENKNARKDQSLKGVLCRAQCTPPPTRRAQHGPNKITRAKVPFLVYPRQCPNLFVPVLFVFHVPDVPICCYFCKCFMLFPCRTVVLYIIFFCRVLYCSINRELCHPTSQCQQNPGCVGTKTLSGCLDPSLQAFKPSAQAPR